MDSEEDDDIEVLFPPLDLEVGTQVSVYWSDEDEFFNGQVERRHRRDTSKYLVQYDDGDAWWLDTREDQFSWPQSNDIKLPTMSERISVGSRVAVWWTKEKKYFHATVEEIREDDEKPHRLGYDDGDEEWTDLDFRKVYFLEGDEDDCEDEDYNNRSKSRQKKDTSSNGNSRKRKRNNEGGTFSEVNNSNSRMVRDGHGSNKQKEHRKQRTWKECFQELKQFYEEHGHTNVKRSHPTLGSFVRHQKETPVLAQLTDEQRVLLASINFDLRTREEKLNAQWNASFMKLKEFKYKNGNTCVTKRQDYTLANWCTIQRRSKKDGSLADNRVKLLEEIGFDFLISSKEAKSHAAIVRTNRNRQDRVERTAGIENMNGEGTEDAKSFRDVSIQNKDDSDKQKERRIYRTWMEQFQELKQFYEEHGHTNVKRSHTTLGWFVRRQKETPELAKLTDEQRGLLVSINFDLRTREEKLNDNWNASYLKLKAFKEKHGNIQVLSGHDDSTLMNWCVRQRKLKKEGTLAEHRLNLLKEIGFNFLTSSNEAKSNRSTAGPTGNAQDQVARATKLYEIKNYGGDKTSAQRTWDEHFQELKQFFEENGHSDIKTSHPTLGKWVKDKIRSSSGRLKLTDAQKAMLASVNFDLRTYEERLDNQWTETFEKLKDFKKKYGHTLVQKSQDSALAGWTYKQRKQRREGSLPENRKRKLEGIDFDWHIDDKKSVDASEGKICGVSTSNDIVGKSTPVRRKPRTWDEHFQELKQFYDENGHSDIPQLHPILGSWVKDNIRSSIARSKLTDTQKAMLASVNFDMRTQMDNQWMGARQSRSLDANTPNDTDEKNQSVRRKPRTWDEYFQELKRFYDENGHSNVTQSHPTLGYWIKDDVRRANSRSELTDAQKAMLASVKFDMRTHEEKLNDQWNDAFIKLKKFKSEHGHTKVQKSDDSYLARWVKKQKENRKACSIRKDRKELLEEIDFEWN